MSPSPPAASEAVQSPPAEDLFKTELAFLAAFDRGSRPPGWRLTPRAVVTFVLGSKGAMLKLPRGARSLITEKFVGDQTLVERAVVTLASECGLLLWGKPGTAKSLLSELLSAAICGSSACSVQATAITAEAQLRYCWNESLVAERGPHPEALFPSPILAAMRKGAVVRIEEVGRLRSDVQESLAALVGERRVSIPELGGNAAECAMKGFNVIATSSSAELELAPALRRRFRLERVEPIADPARELALVRDRTRRTVERTGETAAVDDELLGALVTLFRDLRSGMTEEGWGVSRPAAVMSTAEALEVAAAVALQASYFPSKHDHASLLSTYLLGTVVRNNPRDREPLLLYWDGVAKRRAESGQRIWQRLYAQRGLLLAE